jgi:hypothetical protein
MSKQPSRKIPSRKIPSRKFAKSTKVDEAQAPAVHFEGSKEDRLAKLKAELSGKLKKLEEEDQRQNG